MLRRDLRLGSRQKVQAVFRRGVRASQPAVAVRVLVSGEAGSRFAIATAREIGHRPARNRARRRVAHALRALVPEVGDGLDVVIVARREALVVPFAELRRQLWEALRAAGAGRP
ncbi:MAG: ribonuclease P protein component [Clostridia bacterium]|nr:ribonuclease P protein component [Clostridia bacterium]